jgi:hypothetical protein
MACFCGLPSFINIRMLEDTVLSDLPFLSGMIMTHSDKMCFDGFPLSG